MLEQTVTIVNKVGLHARPAAVLIKLTSSFPCEVALVKDGKPYNAKSILSVMGAGIKQDDIIHVRVNGEGEAQALEAVVSLINSGFGER
ncbi:MAG: Phosphotransferase system, phosphocarrier protein HPr [Sporomusa sp.]|jgi:phosphocarrier protein|nr:Phosphotransferase system, phosphocarrier protein HPr [Sporomusa sp.]